MASRWGTGKNIWEGIRYGTIRGKSHQPMECHFEWTSSTIHAHHIIPLAFKEHVLIQKAANSPNAFHINEMLNGIPLPSTGHLTGHNVYNAKIQSILTTNNNAIDNMNPDEAFTFLNGLISHINDLILTNSNKNLGEIANLINYP